MRLFRSQRWLTFLELASLLLLPTLAYLPSLSGDFHFDDHLHLTNNPALQHFKFSLSSLAEVAFHSPLKTRGLSYLSFALDSLRAGFSTSAFHQTNLLLHLVNTLLAWRVLLFLFAHPRFRLPWPRTAAFLGALFFSLHPVQVQSVAYIVQRMNLLASLFTLLGLWGWLKLSQGETATKKTRFSLWALLVFSCLLGLWSKETAVSLFFLMAVVDRVLFPGDFFSWTRKRWRLVLVLLLLVVCVSLFYALVSGGLFAGYKYRSFTWGERLLTQPRVIWWYLSLWFFPAGHRLSLEHDFMVSTGLFHPPVTAFAIFFLVALTLVALWRAERSPLLSLGWLWFMASLFLESSVLPLEMVFEHRLYLPSLGLIMMVTGLVSALGLGRKSLLAFFVLALIFGMETYSRNLVWRTPVSLAQDSVRKAPSKARPWANLCALALSGEELRSAEAWCQAAIKRDQTDANSWYNLGLVLLKELRFQEAESALWRSNQLHRDPETLYQLARACYGQGKYDQAEKAAAEAVQLLPTDPVYWYHLGLARLALGKKEPAQTALQEALKLLPPDSPSRGQIQALLQSL